jgi:hypothetical protein
MPVTGAGALSILSVAERRRTQWPSHFESQLYRAAGATWGNVEAAERGPTAFEKRTVRRKVYRSTNSGLASLLAVGLDLVGTQLSGFGEKFQAAVPRRALAMWSPSTCSMVPRARRSSTGAGGW